MSVRSGEEDPEKTCHEVRTGRVLYLRTTRLRDREVNEENEGAVEEVKEEEAAEEVDRGEKHHYTGAAHLHAAFQMLTQNAKSPERILENSRGRATRAHLQISACFQPEGSPAKRDVPYTPRPAIAVGLKSTRRRAAQERRTTRRENTQRHDR